MSKSQRTRIPSSAPGPASSAPGPAADEALARLLSAAAPPLAADWTDRELPGEAGAMAAFRLGPDSVPGSMSDSVPGAVPGSGPGAVPGSGPGRRPARFGRLFTLKTVIAVAALSGGGIALAAATGHSAAQHRPPPAPARSAIVPAGTGRPMPTRSSGPVPPPREHLPAAPSSPASPSSTPGAAGASASVSVGGGAVSGSAGVNARAPKLPVPSLPVRTPLP